MRVVFTPTGQVLGRSAYLPFGDTLDQSGSLPRQRFTGQERDGEAGLDYFNARSLQVRTGRMSSPDPLFGGAPTDPQGWNRYAYANNNPLTLIDPTGLSPEDLRFDTSVDVVGTMPRSTVEAGVVGANSPDFGVNPSLLNLFVGVGPDQGRGGMSSRRGGGGGRSERGPTLGIGIEVPAASATRTNALNVAEDPGHTFLFLADESGVAAVLSFGPGEPIGVTNKTQFTSGNLTGNANWPLSGNANTWTIPVSPSQFSAGLAAINAFKSNVPNYTPTMQCTAAALSVVAKMGIAIPDGVGPVVANYGGVTLWSGSVANPSTLNRQMTARFGQPAVANTAAFPRR